MQVEFQIVIYLVAAYLIGGIPFGYLIGKSQGVDVRTVGSKNIGATNVFRTVGKKAGIVAFVCDVMKGLIPVLVTKWINTVEWLPLAVGIMTVVGHMLTPYMKFKGGKGVATAFGMLIGLIPGMVGVAFLLFAIVFACSNYISLGSCSAAGFLMVAIWLPILGGRGYHDIPLCILVTLICGFIIFKHRANIKRLIAGNENKIYLFKRNGGTR